MLSFLGDEFRFWRDVVGAAGTFMVVMIALIVSIVIVLTVQVYSDASDNTLTCYAIHNDPYCYVGVEQVACILNDGLLTCPIERKNESP